MAGVVGLLWPDGVGGLASVSLMICSYSSLGVGAGSGWRKGERRGNIGPREGWMCHSRDKRQVA